MPRINKRCYSVYILTNIHRKILYTGMTNSLEERLVEHYLDRIDKKHFTGKYNCYYLVFYEDFDYVNDAIEREKEIKGWLRSKKIKLISGINPGWDFLNETILGQWPPSNLYDRKDS